MFGIGETELAVIIIFAFLLFGPDKLPQMSRTLGRALRQFRTTQEKMTAVVQSEVLDPMQGAMNAPAKPKKSSGAADADDLDADIDEGSGEAPARKETFAERRARLAAEKAAAEQGGEAKAETAPAAGEAPALEESPAEAEAPAAEERPVHRTAADLYARRPKKAAPPEPEEGGPAEDAAAPTDEGAAKRDDVPAVESGKEDAE